MKILIVNDDSDFLGGVEIYVLKIVNELRAGGHSVKLLFENRSIGGKAKRLFRGWLNPAYASKIKRVVNEFKPDIIFAHNIINVVSPMFLLKKKVPVVLTIPNLFQFAYNKPPITSKDWYRVLEFPKKFTHRTIIRKHVDLFIAPSKNTAKEFSKDLRTRKVAFLENPVLFNEKQKKYKQNPNKILFVGRLHHAKGVSTLVKAFSEALKTMPDLELQLVGDGPELTNLKNLAHELGIFDKITFYGFRLPEELPQFYQEAGLFVLPSTVKENSPLTIRESMFFGTPVITTDFGGQAEIVKEGKNGFLFKPYDYKALAEQITNFLNNDGLQKELGENAIKTSKELNLDSHIERLLTLFEETIKRYYHN